ncbi:MAG: hypothetical protein AVDCRST_MAG05-4421, partial [uncultured Rubrobacteraceae bacterium]
GPPFRPPRRRLLRPPRRRRRRLVWPARDRSAPARPAPRGGPAARPRYRRLDRLALAAGLPPDPNHPQARRGARPDPRRRDGPGGAPPPRPLLRHRGGNLLQGCRPAGVRDTDSLRRLRPCPRRSRPAVPALDRLGRPRRGHLRGPVRGDRRPARARHGARRPQRGHAPDLEALQGRRPAGPV